MLKLSLTGRVGKDAVMRKTNNKTVISFPVAHNERYTGKDGVKVEKTTWIDCSIWRDQETKLASFITKKQWVYLEGYPVTDAYLNKDEEIVTTMKLNVTNLEFIGDKVDRSEGKEDQASRRKSTPPPAKNTKPMVTAETVDDPTEAW